MIRFALCFTAALAMDRKPHKALVAVDQPATGTSGQLSQEIVPELVKVGVEIRETACQNWREFISAYNQIVNRMFDLGAASAERKGTWQLINQLEDTCEDTSTAPTNSCKSIARYKKAWENARQEAADESGKMQRYTAHAEEEANNAARLAHNKQQVEDKYGKMVQEQKTLLTAFANAYAAVTKSSVADTFKKYVDENTADSNGVVYDNNAYTSGTQGICVDDAADANNDCPIVNIQDKNACIGAAGCVWQTHYSAVCKDDGTNTCTLVNSPNKDACDAADGCKWGPLNPPDFVFFIQRSMESEPEELSFADKVKNMMRNIGSAMARLAPEQRKLHDHHMEPLNPVIALAQGKQPWTKRKADGSPQDKWKSGVGMDATGQSETDFAGFFNSNKVDNQREEMIANWLLQSVKETDKIVTQMQNELNEKTAALELLEKNAKDDADQATKNAADAMDAATAASDAAHTAEQEHLASKRLRESLVSEQADLLGTLARLSNSFLKQMGDSYDELLGLHTAGLTLAQSWSNSWGGTFNTNSEVLAGGSNNDGLRCGDVKEAALSAQQLEGMIEQFGDHRGTSNFRGLYGSGANKFWEVADGSEDLTALLALLDGPNFAPMLDGTTWAGDYLSFQTAVQAKAAWVMSSYWDVQDAAQDSGDALHDAKSSMDADLHCYRKSNGQVRTQSECLGMGTNAASEETYYPCVYEGGRCQAWSEAVGHRICLSKTSASECSGDCTWQDTCVDANGNDIGSFNPTTMGQFQCEDDQQGLGGYYTADYCMYIPSRITDYPYFLQTGEENHARFRQTPVSCDTKNPSQTQIDNGYYDSTRPGYQNDMNEFGKDCNDEAHCVFDYKAAQPECVARFIAEAPLIAFEKDTEAANVFTSLIAPVKQRKRDLQVVLQQLRSQEANCKMRLNKHNETMRASVLRWNEFYQKFDTARLQWQRAESSYNDAEDRVKNTQDMVAKAGIQHAKAQAQYKARIYKWQKGERALSDASNALRLSLKNDNSATVRLIDSIRDRMIRQQAQATEDIEYEHAEYKRNLRHSMNTLNAFETEAGNAESAMNVASDRMNAAWDQVKFLDYDGEEQDPTLEDFNGFDSWPVQPSYHTDAGNLKDANGDGLVDMVMITANGEHGGEDSSDGTQTKDVWAQTKDVLKFDKCETVQIGVIIDDGDNDPQTDFYSAPEAWNNITSGQAQSQRNSDRYGAWGDTKHALDGSTAGYTPSYMSASAKDLYAEQNDKTWNAARLNIQEQINKCIDLLGMLSRFVGAAQTSNIINPTPYR